MGELVEKVQSLTDSILQCVQNVLTAEDRGEESSSVLEEIKNSLHRQGDFEEATKKYVESVQQVCELLHEQVEHMKPLVGEQNYLGTQALTDAITGEAMDIQDRYYNLQKSDDAG